jgi:adenylate cyclase
MMLIGVLAAFLAIVVEQSRRFVITRVEAERDATSLAKFFPPAIAARIAGSDGDQLSAARRFVAILFARVGASAGVPSSLEKVQSQYNAVEQIVFRHGGVLDRFTGGAVMAVFGALDGEGDDQLKAFNCARQLILGSASTGTSAAIGLHAGWTICGDFGGGRCRTFSVIGDSVNVARRILDAAEGQGGGLLVSGDLLGSVAESKAVDGSFIDLGEIALKNRAASVHLWRHQP